MQPISRRTFLAAGASIAVAGAVASCSSDDENAGSDTATSPSTPAAPSTPTAPSTESPSTEAPSTEPPAVLALAEDPFVLGVASGDPDATSVVLWTRLIVGPTDAAGDPLPEDIDVQWQAGKEADASDALVTGSTTASAAHGFAVHAVAELGSGEWFYRFTAGGQTSPVGRAVVADADTSEARFVTASCQNFQHGYYTAHDDIAAQRPDFVMFLGDYIYEAAAADADGVDIVRSHEGPEPIDLEAYRRRYETYRSDPALQAAHAACPWFVVWDDHEVENNYASTQPQSDDDLPGWEERRFAAYTAWWEHMPVRLPPPTAVGDDYPIYRAATWGSLIGITLLDGRQYRDDQACGDATLTLEPPCDEVFAADRTMLGEAQERFLFDTLGRQSTVWNVVGQQTVFNDVTFNGSVLNFDQWDGYPAARARIVDHLAAEAIDNVVFLTGDVHLAGIGHIRANRDDAVNLGVEFVATSISSNANVPADLAPILRSFPTFVDAELERRGYAVHTVTADSWSAEYRIVDTVKTQDGTMSTWGVFDVPAGSSTATRRA